MPENVAPARNPGALQIGATFHGRYEIVRCLKAGGMGAVYEVIHLETRRHRALKVMLPSIVSNAEHRARFRAEATVAADVTSDHIVDTFDAGVDEETGTPFLVMELLEGEDLGASLARRGPFDPAEVVTLLAQAARALDKTHAAGIVHRDLKPENLFLTHRDDGSPRLKVLDFGIAKIVAGGGSTTQALGTPVYMPPEQMRGAKTLGPASDNYALAHVAYRLLVGEAYWEAERQAIEGGLALMLRISQGASEAATARAARCGVTLPPAFDEWFARATDREPEDRYQVASELVAALARALGLPLASVPPSGAHASSAPPSPATPNQRRSVSTPGPAPAKRVSRRMLAVIAGAGVLAAVGGTVFALVSADDRSPARDSLVAAGPGAAVSLDMPLDQSLSTGNGLLRAHYPSHYAATASDMEVLIAPHGAANGEEIVTLAAWRTPSTSSLSEFVRVSSQKMEEKLTGSGATSTPPTQRATTCLGKYAGLEVERTITFPRTGAHRSKYCYFFAHEHGFILGYRVHVTRHATIAPLLERIVHATEPLR